MLLNELFSQPVKWQMAKNPDYDDEMDMAVFNVHGVEYDMTVITTDMGEGDVSGDVEFSAKPDGVDTLKGDDRHHARYGITNTGNASIVMATVIDFLKHVVNKRGLNVLTFSAQEPSRKKLYISMAKRLGPAIGFTDMQINGDGITLIKRTT